MTATIGANAQLNGKHLGNNGVGGNLSIQNNDGNLIPIGAIEDAKGSPFLLESWTSAKIYLKNGTNYTDTSFNYSLFDDQLYCNKNNVLYKVSDQVKEFTFISADNNSISNFNRLFHFANGYPAINGVNSNTFFQVLATGKRYQLLKWQHKKISEVYTYGAKAGTEYTNQIAYYIFDVTKQNMLSIGNIAKASKIKSTLSIDESIWKAYLNNHSENHKGEKAMIDFMSYLN
jgi:hypothetical protein